MIYTAINIGPIVPTLNMVRKPRELWAASLFFSQMMKSIIDAIPENCKLISPAKDEKIEKLGVGLYPDRIFVQGDFDFDTIRNEVIKNYAKAIEVPEIKKDNVVINGYEIVKGYVNLMHVQKDIEASESVAIKELNQIMDWMELNNRETDETHRNVILKFIQKGYDSPLFGMVYSDNKYAEGNSTLAEIATKQLLKIDATKWKEAQDFGKRVEKAEDAFYNKLKEQFPNDIRSYHKYICIIQADGDNMGKTFTHKDLKNNEMRKISSLLLQFDKEATKAILEYGGFPIYAGGDDLLFIAPVVGMTKDKEDKYHNILDLLDQIDKKFSSVENKVKTMELKDDDKNPIILSMSYGISISYYKYPLYEAFSSARKQLFEVAKNVKGKNALAWELKKHSGSSFSGSFSKSDLFDQFKEIINNSSVKESLVSAVSHKIRQNEGLLSIWLDDKNYETRNKCFFEQYLDYKEEDKYKSSVLELLNKLYLIHNDDNSQDENKKDRTSVLISQLYGMLRTAKFIRGEEVIDE